MHLWVLLALALNVTALLAPVERAEAQPSRALARAVERRAVARFSVREALALVRRDAARDGRLPVRELAKKVTTHRYVSGKNLFRELNEGLRAGSHTTSRAVSGRLPSALTAQRKLGLPSVPGWRLKIEWPKGWPVRKGKVLGGGRGVGEMTSPRALPPSAVKGAIRLQTPQR